MVPNFIDAQLRNLFNSSPCVQSDQRKPKLRWTKLSVGYRSALEQCRTENGLEIVGREAIARFFTSLGLRNDDSRCRVQRQDLVMDRDAVDCPQDRNLLVHGVARLLVGQELVAEVDNLPLTDLVRSNALGE